MLVSLSLDLNNLFVPAISCKLHSISVNIELSELTLHLYIDAPTFRVLREWSKQGKALSLKSYKPYND